MGAIDTLKALVGTVKTAKLVSLDKSLDTVELQFNPEKDSLRFSRSVNWEFTEGTWPSDAWGGAANWAGTEPDTLSFTTLLDETTGGAAAWAAAAAKSALAAALVLSVDTTSTTVTKNRLVAFAGMDAAVGLADTAAEALVRTLSTSSIHKTLEKLYWLSTPDAQTGGRKRPSVVQFKWGDFDFVGVVTSLDVQYLVVSSEGYARRAKVDIELTGRAFGGITSADDFLVPTEWARRSSLF